MFTSLCRMRGLSVVQAAALRSRCVAEGGGADAGVEADAEADPLAELAAVRFVCRRGTRESETEERKPAPSLLFEVPPLTSRWRWAPPHLRASAPLRLSPYMPPASHLREGGVPLLGARLRRLHLLRALLNHAAVAPLLVHEFGALAVVDGLLHDAVEVLRMGPARRGGEGRQSPAARAPRRCARARLRPPPAGSGRDVPAPTARRWSAT